MGLSESQRDGQQKPRPELEGLQSHERLGSLMTELMDPQRRLVGDYARSIISTLFLDEPVEAFRPESLDERPEVDLSSDGRKIRRAVLALLGYAPKDQEMFDTRSTDLLNVHFSSEPGTLTSSLNDLPMIRTIEGVSQTDIRQSERILSRYDHSQHIAFNVARTMIRLALQQPELFIKKVESDLLRYNQEEHAEFKLEVSEETQETIREMLKEGGLELSDQEIHALGLALEYAKYAMVYAYLHDSKTPGWGDIRMHAPGLDYSEDVMLGEHIAEDIDDPTSGLPQLVKKHGLDPRLLEVIVRRSAMEMGDGTLIPYLMKDKGRKDENGEKIDGFDHDQDSGTVANLAHLATDLLPGGFKHKRADTEAPIGSYSLRLKLLALMMTGAITKEDLTTWYQKNGIDPDLIYIAEEEISIGRHIKLVELDSGEIRTVVTSPTAMKRILLTSAVLESLFYKGGDRIVTEKLVQSVIGNMGKNYVEIFFGRSDYHVRQALKLGVPSLLYILDRLPGEILSEEELREKAIEQEDGTLVLDGYLVFPAPQRKILKLREGTLVENDEGEYLPTSVIFDGVRRDGGATLVDRFEAVNKITESPGYYYTIKISQDDQEQLGGLFILGEPELANAVIKTLQEWSSNVQLGSQQVGINISSPLLRDILRPQEKRRDFTDEI